MDSDPYTDGAVEYILVAVGVIIIISNSVELGLIIKCRRTIKTFEQLLSSLAIADLLTGLLLVAFRTDKLINHPNKEDSLDGNILFCLILTTVMISLLSLMSISIDRLISVKYPIVHRSYVTSKRTWIVAIIEWVIAWLLVPIPIMAGRLGWVEAKNMAQLYSKVVAWFLLIFGVASGLTYIEIARSVYTRPQVRSTFRNPNAAREIRNRKTEKAVLSTCVLVVTAYMVFTTPFAVRILKGKQPLREFSGIMLFCNSLVNPMIYFFKGYLEKKIRKMSFNQQRVEAKAEEIKLRHL